MRRAISSFFLKIILSCSMLAATLSVSARQVIPDAALVLADSGYIFKNPPFENCHAATIAALPGNKLIAAWFAGKHEGADDVGIRLSAKNKKNWSKPVEVANGLQADGKRYPCWNPVLFYTRDGSLLLFYKAGANPRTWWGEMKISDDGGKTWSPARRLPDGFIGPVKNKPVQLPGGELLHPSSIETEEGDKWIAHLELSDSRGSNWQKILLDCDTFGVIQPSILTYDNGRMQLLCRSRQNVIVQSWSADYGKSWDPITATGLPNPNSGTDAVTLSNGWQLLVYNPLLAGKEWWEGRSVLKVALSADGINWKDVFTLEEHAKGEYSYPAVIQSPDGMIHIMYTHARTKIKHVQLKINTRPSSAL